MTCCDTTASAPHAAGRSWFSARAIGAIRWYQRAAEGRPSPCRFYPSCSSYALEAFEVHGTWRASALTVRRLLRCRPFGPSGVDPVPLPSPTPDMDD
jgi:putative membrane protein insertion efficiency factor